MEVSLIGWILIVFFLFVTTFGLQACVNILSACIAFIAGVLTMLYLAYDNGKTSLTTEDLLDNPLEQSSYTSTLARVMNIFNEPKKVNKTDTRITGSESVDTFLHEIFGYLIRDYVTPWYSIITSDNEFVEGIRQTAQSVAVNVSNRVKSVDWLSYLLGRPVEDVTGHLRLFRSAGGGAHAMAPSPSRLPRRGSPARSPPSNTPQHHRRNKSDTDVASYAGKQRNIANSRFYIDGTTTKSLSFEQQFFKLEREMEKNLISREKMCIDQTTESTFIAEMCQLLFYVTMEASDFRGGASLAVLRAISFITLHSGLSYITDPDSLNTLLLRFICYDGLSSESFLSVIRSTDNVEELKSTLDLVQKEIQNLVSHDTVGECDIAVKQQLSSLQYLVRILNTRSSALMPCEPSEQRHVVTQLPLSFLLDNHLALGYFLDYAQSMGAHEYIFCHLQIQAWRAAAIKHFAAHKSGQKIREGTITEIISAAQAIYDQYLAGGILSSGDVPHTLVRNLIGNFNMAFDERSVMWFQEVEDYIISKLKIVSAGFKNSRQYSMLLAELDIENINSSDSAKFVEAPQCDNGTSQNFDSKTSLSSLSDSRLCENSERDVEKTAGLSKFFIDNIPNTQSQSPVVIKSTDHITNEISKEFTHESSPTFQIQDPQKQIQQWIIGKESCHLEADIYETGVVHERGKAFGVYAVAVTRRCPTTGRQFCWHVYRRYSDFLELYNSIKERFPELGKMEFPSKKTFHNTSRGVLERRKEVLSTWLSALATLGSPNGPSRYAVLHSSLLLPFLSPKGLHDKHNQQRVIDTMLVQPLRQGMRTLRGVPSQLFSTVDDFMEGISKVLNSKSDSAVVLPCHLQTAGVMSLQERDFEGGELPLRVLLLLLDEVFELRKRNQWLRRQIAALLRQLLTAMFADVLNKRIIDFISSITSPGTIVQCLDVVKRKYWSVGNGAPRRSDPRDEDERARARVAVKAALLGVCQEELKHIIGSETTHRGLMTIFELFQNPVLNKRLIFVLVEGLIGTLYPDMDVKGVMKRLLKTSHSLKMAHLQVN